MATNDETIAANISKPQSVSSDAGSVTQHNLKDQIAAAEYLANQQGNSSRKLPIRLVKFRPGGTTGTGN